MKVVLTNITPDLENSLSTLKNNKKVCRIFFNSKRLSLLSDARTPIKWFRHPLKNSFCYREPYFGAFAIREKTEASKT